MIDVIHSDKTNRLYLVLAPAIMDGDPHYLMPLLCPVCGLPWHFVWNDTPEQLAVALKKSMAGFELVQVKYFPCSTAINIVAVMEKLSLGSGPAELFIENVADHLREDDVFPVITLSFEQRIPSQFPSPEELRSMSQDDVRNALDLDDQEDIEEAIREVEEWMVYDDYEVEDDILLAVHPNAILDAIVVKPKAGPDESSVYLYQTYLNRVEDPDYYEDADEDEVDGLNNDYF